MVVDGCDPANDHREVTPSTTVADSIPARTPQPVRCQRSQFLDSRLSRTAASCIVDSWVGRRPTNSWRAFILAYDQLRDEIRRLREHPISCKEPGSLTRILTYPTRSRPWGLMILLLRTACTACNYGVPVFRREVPSCRVWPRADQHDMSDIIRLYSSSLRLLKLPNSRVQVPEIVRTTLGIEADRYRSTLPK